MTVPALSSLRLAHVQAFMAVVQFGSYSAAAREIGCAQSTVSRSVESLNKFVKGKLFDDDPMPTLTALGELFLPRAIKLMDWANECVRLNAAFDAVEAEEAALVVRRKQRSAKLKKLLKFRLGSGSAQKLQPHQ